MNADNARAQLVKLHRRDLSHDADPLLFTRKHTSPHARCWLSTRFSATGTSGSLTTRAWIQV